MESLNFIYNNNFINYLSDNPALYFVFLIICSFIFAKIVDVIFIKFLSKLVKKTKSEIDDKILFSIHQPLYYSLLFIGFRFSISIKDFYLTQNHIFIITAILKSISIILWSIALFRIFMLLINWYTSKSANSKLIDSKLLPLFDNIGKIIIFSGGAYLVMVSWGVNPVGWLA